jgi:hypothetical protein
MPSALQQKWSRRRVSYRSSKNSNRRALPKGSTSFSPSPLRRSAPSLFDGGFLNRTVELLPGLATLLARSFTT